MGEQDPYSLTFLRKLTHVSSIMASWKSFQNWWNIKAYKSISLSESLKLIMRIYILYFSTNNKYEAL